MIKSKNILIRIDEELKNKAIIKRIDLEFQQF